jgi:hypothetical protein
LLLNQLFGEFLRIALSGNKHGLVNGMRGFEALTDSSEKLLSNLEILALLSV